MKSPNLNRVVFWCILYNGAIVVERQKSVFFPAFISMFPTVAMRKLGYVDPYDGTDTFCFLQGEEADRFQAEATELWENEELDLDMDTILLYLAEPYTVLIDE